MSDGVNGSQCAAPGDAERHWWALTPDGAMSALDTSADGLSQVEAAERLRTFGPNELAAKAGVNLAAILLRQFTSPLIYILLVAALVTIVLQEYIDSCIIGAVLLMNAVIGFNQEYRAERSMEALRKLATTRAHVIRNARERQIDARELAPGDIVLLDAGAKVPADCRIVHSTALEADESLITGESTTVAKSNAPLAEDTPVPDRASMLLTGTVVTRGRGRAVVVATGYRTQLGLIAESVGRIEEAQPPLLRRMDRFARIVGIAVLVASAAGFLMGLAMGEDAHDLFLTLVALAVAAIPEGLPVVLTITLAIGVKRMAARHVIMRRLPAVETLGSCDVIGSDKTGTLTQNRMTVARVFTEGQVFHVTGGGYEASGQFLLDGRMADVAASSPLRLTLLAGALCNDAAIVQTDGELEVHGDPTETALLVAAAKAGLFKDELEERYPRQAEIPFDPERRYAATLHEDEGAPRLFVKGAPEQILEMCTDATGEPALDRQRVLQAAHDMASDGLRVLAMAYRELASPPEELIAEEHLTGLTFLGLQGMIDPPREEAMQAVRGCQQAGIRVIMITGDHATTGLAIAQELGIAGEEGRSLTGADLDQLDDAALHEAARETAVYARVSPEQKLRIVTAIQGLGHTMAVTGDGVNDGPALKAADIGVAMGRSGTDVAKEASDMVITDDNFASIFAAVEEGRIVFDNVRMVTFFLIATGVGTVLAVLASILFRFQLPLLPAQLLWLNLVTNGIQDVALAFEPGEKDVLRRPPRPRGEGIISPVLWERTAIAGAVMAAGTVLLFLLEVHGDASSERARTVALTTMVLFQVFHVGNSRSEHLSAFAKSPFSNRLLFVGTAIALAIHIGALYLPPTQYILRVEPLDLWMWPRMIAVALAVIVAVELHKLVRRQRERRTTQRGLD
ncbi:MAG: HAD-IC family P-type ATPase [Dehalococcoidia bacterium]